MRAGFLCGFCQEIYSAKASGEYTDVNSKKSNFDKPCPFITRYGYCRLRRQILSGLELPSSG